MTRHRVVHGFTLVVVTACAAIGQNTGRPASDQKSPLRVCIAVPQNASGRSITPSWERDQVIRELRRMKPDRKSSVMVEPISLESSSLRSAESEAGEKGCQYFVLTTLTSGQGGIAGNPGAGASAPTMIGNTKAGRILAADFSIIEVSDNQTIVNGTATGLIGDGTDTSAADEAMRMEAHRIASELRNSRPPKID